MVAALLLGVALWLLALPVALRTVHTDVLIEEYFWKYNHDLALSVDAAGSAWILVFVGGGLMIMLRWRAFKRWFTNVLVSPPVLDWLYIASACRVLACHPLRNFRETWDRRTSGNGEALFSLAGGHHRLTKIGFVEKLSGAPDPEADLYLGGRFVRRERGLMLYGLVRNLQPSLVVETGVAGGIISSYILQALADNGHGKLISIDVAPEDYIATYYGESPDSGVGKHVPEHLRDRWELDLRGSEVALPEVLSRNGQIDLFLHDSLHTEGHMLFEWNTAWPHLSPGAVLVTHDVTQAFADWADTVARRDYWLWERYGAVVK